MLLSKKELNKLHGYIESQLSWDWQFEFTEAGYGFCLRDREREVAVSILNGCIYSGTLLKIERKGKTLYSRWVESFEDVRIFKAIVLGIG